jgi:hypothetical protein
VNLGQLISADFGALSALPPEQLQAIINCVERISSPTVAQARACGVPLLGPFTFWRITGGVVQHR